MFPFLLILDNVACWRMRELNTSIVTMEQGMVVTVAGHRQHTQKVHICDWQIEWQFYLLVHMQMFIEMQLYLSVVGLTSADF